MQLLSNQQRTPNPKKKLYVSKWKTWFLGGFSSFPCHFHVSKMASGADFPVAEDFLWCMGLPQECAMAAMNF
jgi:hypothetical protein